MINKTPMMLINNKEKNDWDEKHYRNIVIGQGVYVHQLMNYHYYLPLFSETVQKECNIILVGMMRDFFNKIIDRYLVFMQELGNGMNKITDEDLKDLIENSKNESVGYEEVLWNIFSAAACMSIDIQSTIWMELSMKMMELEATLRSKFSDEIDKLGISFSLLGGDNVQLM